MSTPDVSAASLEPQFWATLLLTEAAGSCQDIAIEAFEPGEPGARARAAGASTLPPVISAADVVLSAPLAHDPSLRLVWLKTQRSKGVVTGPLALVAVRRRYVEVLAMGPLRLPEGETTLSYVDMHEFGAARIDVRRCSAQIQFKPQLCDQIMRLMPHHEKTLWAGLRGDADVELTSAHELPAKKRFWVRRVEHQAQVELCQGSIILTESAALKEYHTQRSNMPPRVVRQAEAIRTLRWEHHSWQCSEAPLWQMMADSDTPQQR